MSDKQKDQGEAQRREVPAEVKAAPELQRNAVIADDNNQARWLRAQQIHSSDQNKSATDMFRKPGEASVSSVKFGIDGLANDKPTGRNANGKPYTVHTQEATQALEKPSSISKSTTEGAYQSEIKLSVQITNMPEVPAAVSPQEAMKYTTKVMEAGALSVRQTEDYLAKPNAINNSLNDMAVAGSRLPGHFSQSPEQLNKDAQSFAGALVQKAGEVFQAIDKPMTPDQRATMAGGMLPLFFFEGGKEIDPNVAKQMQLERLTEAELKALGIERKAEQVADQALEKKSKKPAEIMSEALDNQEGLAKLAKKFGINMPPKDTYVFLGEKEAMSAEATAKRLGLTSEQLKNLDNAFLASKNLERVPNYRDAFFNSHPGLIPMADKIFVHHSLPQDLLTKYPGLFSAAEVNSVDGLRGIYKSTNAKLHNGKINKDWFRFFKAHKSDGLTKQRVLDMRNFVDKQYGHQFIPEE